MARHENRAVPSLWSRVATDRRLFYLVPVVALFIPLIANPYIQFVVNLMLVYVLVAIGFNIVIGNLGQLAFANTAFFGIGAYATGILMVYAGLPFWVALIPGGIAGALAGFLASVTALRGIRLYYLAIITLAFGELMRWIYIHADTVTRGTDGLPIPLATVFGFALDSEIKKFYVFLIIVVLVVKGTANLLRSRVGRAIMAIKDNELATASLGIPTAQYIVLAFIWSGFVVGIAGGMFAVLIGRVVPESFGLIELIVHFAMVMVGGLGSLAGSVLGAITLTALPEYFRSFPGLEEMFFGVLLVLVLLFRPKGLASFLAQYMPIFRERFYRE
jgi:branched-chain amino acid transport system permease protein